MRTAHLNISDIYIRREFERLEKESSSRGLEAAMWKAKAETLQRETDQLLADLTEAEARLNEKEGA